MTVGHPMAIVVVTGIPVIVLPPAIILVTRAAGLALIRTVMLPIAMEPVQIAPETRSPVTAAGWPPTNTLAIPGPVIVSPVAVVSPILAAGNGMLAPFASLPLLHSIIIWDRISRSCL